MMDRKLEQLAQCMVLRIRKGAIPNPKTSVFDALPPELAEESIDIEGTIIQRFGDGYEEAIEAFGRKLYRVPKMDGAFHVERSFGVVGQAVTGGMFLILAESDEVALAAAEASLEAVSQIPLVVVKNAASGSKVGARNYRDMVATTNHHYCPLLAGDADSALPDSVRCVYEIIVSAPRLEEVREGMRVGIEAATSIDGVKQIHTANYGGKLGKGKIYLHSLFR
jgi:formylmethanofuran--tetrahydromethanopterin N-formyltransferase